MSLPEDFWNKTTEHLILSFGALLIAFPLGVSFACLTQTHPRIRNTLTSLINILQTIPSLALFAFLIPWLGIGMVPALFALVIYAILPILRSTLTGLSECQISLMEAAQVFGLNHSQILFQVQIPQSLPQILSGTRTALVWTIGTASLASFIGAGGLGDYIARGIALLDSRLLLTGAIPIALLAFTSDLIFSKLEASALRWKYGKS